MLETICSIDNKEGYDKYLNLESKIQFDDSLYAYFDDILKLLQNEKSYIRVRAFRLICLLAQYDSLNKINNNIEIILEELKDDKPTVIRQCLNYLNSLLLYKPELIDIVIKYIKNINLSIYKDSMRPLIEKDIKYIIDHI